MRRLVLFLAMLAMSFLAISQDNSGQSPVSNATRPMATPCMSVDYIWQGK